MTHRSTTAVIVHWGDPRPTVELALHYLRVDSFSKIVVVANDLLEQPPELDGSAILWVVPPRNLGFGGGCNFGARVCPAAKYAFLNSDLVLAPKTISRCLDALELPDVGISAPALYFPNGGLQSGCGSVSRHLKIARSNRSPGSPISECDWVTGAALFCRYEVLESVGFDGSYFLGVEDVDFGYRAKLCGWRVVLLSEDLTTHSARATLGGARPVYYGIRNQIWFARRHGSFVCSAALTILLLRAIPRVMFADLVKRRTSHVLLLCHGLVAGWSMLPSTKDPLPDEPIPSRWIDWEENR
jgi:N-acetylglucosaminyl-diphospho-decaprenol L-rhamnosyltransferase